MIDGFDHTHAALSGYRREQAIFSEMKSGLQRRKRARWRLGLALRIAGRRPMRRQAEC